MALAKKSHAMLVVQRLVAVHEVIRTSASSKACADNESTSSSLVCRESCLRPSRPYDEVRNLIKAL